MAEQDEIGKLLGSIVNKNDIVNTIDILFIVLIVLVVLLLVFFIGLVIYKRGQYKHTFIRKIITGGTPITIIDKAKEFKEKKNGTILWRLLNAGHIIARPPNEAITPSNKGNYCVEAYYVGDINYYYSRATLDDDTKDKIRDLAKSLNVDYDTKLIDKIRAEVTKVQKMRLFNLFNYKPSPIYIYAESLKEVVTDKKTITTNQRLIAFDEIKTAYERKQNGLAQWLPTVVSVGALVMLVIVVIVFGNDLIKPMIELNNANVGIAQSQALTAQKMSDAITMLGNIINERQMMNAAGLINKTAPG